MKGNKNTSINQRPSEDIQNNLQAENKLLQAELEFNKNDVTTTSLQLSTAIIEKLDTIIRSMVGVILNQSLSNTEGQIHTDIIEEDGYSKEKHDSKKNNVEEMENLHRKYMGETLKYWRKKNGISVYELSKKTRLHHEAIINIEAGRKRVQYKTFLRYAWYIKDTQPDFDLMQTYIRWHNYGIGLNGEDRNFIQDMAEVLDAPDVCAKRERNAHTNTKWINNMTNYIKK